MIYGKVWAFLIVFVAYLMQDTNALKCWQCASDAMKFCGRNLDTRNLTETQRRATYVECGNGQNAVQFNTNGEEVMVQRCEVFKQIIINSEEVYNRGCTLAPKNASTNKCLSVYSDTSFVKKTECRTCTSDGCNEWLDNASIGVKVTKVLVVSLIVLTVLLV